MFQFYNRSRTSQQKSSVFLKSFLWPAVLKSCRLALERLGLVDRSICWAHERREFIDAGTKYFELSSWSDDWIERIAAIYHLNNERIKCKRGSSSFRKYDIELREKIDGIYALTNQDYEHPEQSSVMESMKNRAGLTLLTRYAGRRLCRKRGSC